MSGDPHFTVPLLSGQTLCYGVQGYPGLAFNLVSNYHFVINALFIDDASQNDTDATWIGKLAIIPRNVEQEPVIIFDSSTQQVIIKNQSEFKASIVRQISISGSNAVNVKFTKGISKHQSSPMVHVIYRHPMASFSITFHSNHLDVDWHIQDEYLTQSHGLMGKECLPVHKQHQYVYSSTPVLESWLEYNHKNYFLHCQTHLRGSISVSKVSPSKA